MLGKLCRVACLAVFFISGVNVAWGADPGAALPGTGESVAPATSPAGRVQVDTFSTTVAQWTSSPLRVEAEQRRGAVAWGRLPAWLSQMLRAPESEMEEVHWLDSELRPLGSGYAWTGLHTPAPHTAPLDFGQEGSLDVATETDYVRGYGYAENGALVPTIGTVADSISCHQTVFECGDRKAVEAHVARGESAADLSRTQWFAPVVYEDGARRKRVRVSVSQPVVTHRGFQTTVRAGDGEPTALGGIAYTESWRRRTGVPVLRSIPLIGPVFGGTVVEHMACNYCEGVRTTALGWPEEPVPARFPGARPVVVRLRVVRFVADDGAALPAELDRLPNDWQMLGRLLKVPDVLLGEAVQVADRLLTAAPGTVSQREVLVVALAGAPFEARDETDHTYISTYSVDEAGRPLPEIGELTSGMSLAGTARTLEDGTVTVNAELRVARLDGYQVEQSEMPSSRPDGNPGPSHRLQIDIPDFVAARLTIDENLVPGETCLLDVHGAPPGSTNPQVSVYLLTADVLEE